MKDENNTNIDIDIPPKRHRYVFLWIITGVIITLLIAVGAFGIYGLSQVKPLKDKARLVKAEVKEVITAIALGDPDLAIAKSDKMLADNKELRESVQTPYWKVMAKVPVAKKQLGYAIELTHILDDVDAQVFRPIIQTMKEHPTNTLSVNGSLQTDTLLTYIELVNTITPRMTELSKRMNAVDVSLMDGDGKIAKYINYFTYAEEILNTVAVRVTAPVEAQLLKYSPNDIKTETGFNNEALKSYLKFIDDMLPEIQFVTDYVNDMNLKSIDSKGVVKGYAADIKALCIFLDDASDKVIIPLIDKLDECPLDNMKVEDGFDVRVVSEYLNFIENVIPNFRSVAKNMETLKFKQLDDKGAISDYKEMLNHIVETFDEGEQYISLLQSVLGDGSDKFYFVGTQNTGEIRASGGFPGSVGSFEIKDGILKIGKFQSIYNVFRRRNPVGSDITQQEKQLFAGMPYPWDADFCPDFERVAKIWALAYEEKNGRKVDGVISMTPSIIQELLKFLGEIELSDGTLLNGDNTAAFLQNGVYVKYINRYSEDYKGNDYVDQLFDETAEKTMELLVGQFSISYLPDFLEVLGKGIEDRTIMFWFADEKEQQTARETLSNGSLSRDEKNPVAGIYFNLVNASKMGWYLDIDTEYSDPVENEDGSYTYDVTVKYSNIMTRKEASSVSGYIGRGYMSCKAYMFAPAGGTVSDFKTDNGGRVRVVEYSDLPMGYLSFSMNAEQSVTVTYKLTTAPGAEPTLQFSMTPTATQYRVSASQTESAQP